jgi:hypothetical protein
MILLEQLASKPSPREHPLGQASPFSKPSLKVLLAPLYISEIKPRLTNIITKVTNNFAADIYLYIYKIQINFIYTNGVGAAAQLFGLDLDGSDLLLGEGGADFRIARAMHDLCYCILSSPD